MGKKEEYEVKKDCMFYDKKRKACKALRELFCKEENCKFYQKKGRK